MAKMHQILLRLGVPPQTPLGAHSAPPDPLAGSKGFYFKVKRKERERKRGGGRGRERRMWRERTGREGRRRERKGRHGCWRMDARFVPPSHQILATPLVARTRSWLAVYNNPHQSAGEELRGRRATTEATLSFCGRRLFVADRVSRMRGADEAGWHHCHSDARCQLLSAVNIPSFKVPPNRYTAIFRNSFYKSQVALNAA